MSGLLVGLVLLIISDWLVIVPLNGGLGVQSLVEVPCICKIRLCNMPWGI